MKYIYMIFGVLSLSWCVMSTHYNVINGVEVKEYNAAMWKGAGGYQEPNELMPHLFSSHLENREGILLSVGSVRSLIAFSMGNFSHLIMMDIDAKIRNYNRDHLDFIKRLMNEYPNDPDTQRYEYVHSESFETYTTVFARSYYWGNNDEWQKITQALSEERIFVTYVDLLDWQKNEDLKEALQTFGEEVPLTFDISNVMDYTGDRYNDLADTLYFLSDDDAKEQFNRIENHWDNWTEESTPLSIKFSYDPQNLHAVIFTVLSLQYKEIPKACLPEFLGSHKHGDILTFKYHAASFSNFMKFLRAPVGYNNPEGVLCEEVLVTIQESKNLFGNPIDKYILSW